MPLFSRKVSDAKKPAEKVSPTQTHPSNNKFKDLAETSQNINQKLSNGSSSKSSTGGGSSFNMYNIIKDFDWTTSNINQVYDEVPYILLQEFKIGANSQLASLLTNALLIPDVIESSKASLEKFGSALANKAKSVMNDKPFSKFMDGLKKTGGDVSDKISKGIENTSKAAMNQLSQLDNTTDKWADQSLASMYKFLYLRNPTDRWYKFPYFNSKYYNIQNSFEDSASGSSENGTMANLIKGNADFIKNLGKFTDITALTEPGSYVQRTKFYKFESDGPSFTVNFTLYNTITEDAFIRNNIFLQTLLIQNTAHRHNRLLVDPPCIYEVTVPGRGFYPFCSIDAIDISYKGVQRVIGGDGGKDIIVPDAFEVAISIKSLTSNVNNFMVPEFYDGMTNLANERGNIIGGGNKTGDKSSKNTTKVEKSVPSNRGSVTPNTSTTVSEKKQEQQSAKDAKYTINGRPVTKEQHDAAIKASNDRMAAMRNRPLLG